jgi:hypothetical protein
LFGIQHFADKTAAQITTHQKALVFTEKVKDTVICGYNSSTDNNTSKGTRIHGEGEGYSKGTRIHGEGEGYSNLRIQQQHR